MLRVVGNDERFMGRKVYRRYHYPINLGSARIISNSEQQQVTHRKERLRIYHQALLENKPFGAYERKKSYLFSQETKSSEQSINIEN